MLAAWTLPNSAAPEAAPDASPAASLPVKLMSVMPAIASTNPT